MNVSDDIGNRATMLDCSLDDLGLDSVQLFELVLQLEDTFGIEIEAAQFLSIEKVKDIVTLLLGSTSPQ